LWAAEQDSELSCGAATRLRLRASAPTARAVWIAVPVLAAGLIIAVAGLLTYPGCACS
jgi:hypothetical protein